MSTLRRGRFATRVTAGVLAMLVPLTIAIGAAVFALHGTTQHFKTSIRETIRDQHPLNELSVALPNVNVAALYATAGIGTRASYEQLVNRDETAFRRLLSISAHATGGRAMEHRVIQLAYVRWRTYVASANQLVRREIALTPPVLKRVAQEFQAVGEGLHRAEVELWREVRDAQRSSQRHDAATERLLLWLLVLAVALAGAIAFALTRFFSRRLRSLRAGVQRIGDGDLSRPINLQSGDELGELGAAIDAMARDLQAAQSDLHHLALHDPLTQLPNRTLLLDRVERAMHRIVRHGGVAALLVIDLDEFKAVNDSLGHPVGDAMLTSVASRLLEQLRDVDTASRIGGDEFAVLVEDIADDAEVLLIAERILAAIGESFEVHGSELRPRASVGIAIARQGTETAAELLRNADLAMYAAKQTGKNRCVIFEEAMHQDALERASMERALRAAVHREELVLHYQPTIDLASGRITGVEALIRWEHPELGMLSPLRFIPLAEETGLIVPLGQWVLRTACAQLCEWQRSDPEVYGAMKLNVNVSARQLERPGIVADVERVLEQTGIAPGCLVLELTESILASGDELLERLHELRALGVLLAVDDFGTGYSSLAYLRRFPIDVLKIDRCFISGITTRQTDATLASTIIELGRMLDLTTVAEGIEDAEQLELLRQLGCTTGQGFLIAKPLPADDLAALVARAPFYPVGTGKDDSADGIAEVPRVEMRVASPALLDAAADCIALIDDNAMLLYASAAAQRLLGLTVSEWLGRGIFELIHPDDLAEVAEAWVTTVETPGVKTPLALRLRRSDGTWLPVEVISNNMLGEPSVGGVVITIRDRSTASAPAIS